MAQERISDGTVNWIGGMDTSRNPQDISSIQYAKGCNVIIPSSLGGIRARFGLHCAHLSFENKTTKNIYRNGSIFAEGYFEVNNKIFPVALVDGYILKFIPSGPKKFRVEIININDRNSATSNYGWITQVPNGCIVNNGFDYPMFVTENSRRRMDPSKGEIGIGRMGVYVQNRFFYVDQSGRQIIASDFMQPTKNTREGTNIFGFMCPDADEVITAIGKQKSILNYTEGGNLIWSSTKDIYSADIRGTRSDWANLGSRIGKVTETIPGFSAASSYSFESFNSNIYLRTKQFGIVDIKQSEYQFVNLDAANSQSIEASYFLNNDTDWLLDKCYTRACNTRLFTTVAPERTDKGFVFWNGILSFSPATSYGDQGIVNRRFESVFTGVRPWCMTSIKTPNAKDQLLIHSYDTDKINRLYIMDEDSDHDIREDGSIKEIEGFIETRAYNLGNPLLLKNSQERFYRLRDIPRDLDMTVFSRPETSGQWMEMFKTTHLVGRNKFSESGSFIPISHKPQTRAFVYMPLERIPNCYPFANKFISMQYRIEFKGAMSLEALVLAGTLEKAESTTYKDETKSITIEYEFRPDFNYSIQ